MRKMLFWLFYLCAIQLSAQKYTDPDFKSAGRSAQELTPTNWLLRDSIDGDLNGDQLLDKVFVIQTKDSVDIKSADGDNYRLCPSMLVIAMAGAHEKFTVTEYNSRLMIEYNFPPLYDSPFSSMTIGNGKLVLKFSFDFIGGNFQFYTYTFQTSDNKLYLTRAEESYVTRRTMDFVKEDHNFLSNDCISTIGTYSSDDPPKLTEKMVHCNCSHQRKAFIELGQPGSWKLIDN